MGGPPDQVRFGKIGDAARSIEPRAGAPMDKIAHKSPAGGGSVVAFPFDPYLLWRGSVSVVRHFPDAGASVQVTLSPTRKRMVGGSGLATAMLSHHVEWTTLRLSHGRATLRLPIGVGPVRW